MGIFINLAISHSVSQSEWEAVYRDALELAQKLGLADVRRLEIGGVTVRCLSRTQEYTSPSRWLNEDWTGFQICGDYETLGSHVVLKYFLLLFGEGVGQRVPQL
jgi:hypothetical protein